MNLLDGFDEVLRLLVMTLFSGYSFLLPFVILLSPFHHPFMNYHRLVCHKLIRNERVLRVFDKLFL